MVIYKLQKKIRFKNNRHTIKDNNYWGIFFLMYQVHD